MKAFLPVILLVAMLAPWVLGGCDSGESGSSTLTPETTPVDLNIPPSTNKPAELADAQTDFRTMPIPVDNLTTEEGVALGRRLFFDPILSSDDSVSCSSCHDPAAAFSDIDATQAEPFSEGVGGALGDFNAPALINLGWTSADPFRLEFPFQSGEHFSLFWDGRADSLETQAREPVANEQEMNLPWDQAEAKVRADSVYPGMFEAAFGDPGVSQDRMVMAIAQFERTLRSYNSRWDQWVRGEIEPTPDEAIGYLAFTSEVGDCFHCHGGNLALFASPGNTFGNNGLDALPPPGLMEVTGEPLHEGKFRVPTLRNIEFTGPYMHDGRFGTLDEVLEHYSAGVATESPNLDSNLRARALQGPLTPTVVQGLKAFLLMLSDPGFLTDPDFQDPFAPAP
ncbi:MAG: cytochrome c peroxidase [Myxococcota bacterium]|nr:cytochrome c peroxidase [Myxococcota bacterium]